jgi:hypothetical protein
MSFLLLAWSFISSPIGRLVSVGGLSLVLGFSQGWSLKARLDRSATLQAVITKQRIDLKAAQDVADTANTVIAEISLRDANNQDIIRDLNEKLSEKSSKNPVGRCVLDPAAAGSLRRLR